MPYGGSLAAPDILHVLYHIRNRSLSLVADLSLIEDEDLMANVDKRTNYEDAIADE